MKTRNDFPTILAALALTLVGGATAHAAGKPMTASKNLILPEAGDAPIGIQAVVLTTGFEAPAFALGAVEPQNGFTASGLNSPWASISAASPCEAVQHMRLVRDGSVGNGTQRVVFSPNIPQPAGTPSQVKMQLMITNDGGADYDVVGQAPSQALLSWRVKFSFADASGGGPGTIFILDDVGAGLAFQDTGVIWSEGACTELKVQFEPAASQIRYFYQGVQIWTSGIIAGTAVEQVVWVHDNWQLAGESANFDALGWLDTPSDPVPAQPATWGRIKNQYR